jgi:hypothetical protein
MSDSIHLAKTATAEISQIGQPHKRSSSPRVAQTMTGTGSMATATA